MITPPPHHTEARIDRADATADGSTRPRRGVAEAVLRWSGALTLAGTVAMFAFLLVGSRLVRSVAHRREQADARPGP